MKINIPSSAARGGFTIVMVMILVGTTLVVLAAALNWCSTNTTLIQRNNQYFNTLAAAEAATEKVLSKLAVDYQADGESLVSINMDTYRGMSPVSSEYSGWTNYLFTDGQGNQGKTYVVRSAAASYVPLQSQYQGVYGLASSYRAISNAKLKQSSYAIDAALEQDVQLASIPLFQFAIFYSMDLEINPSPNMNVTGRVHGNANIYLQPVNTLTFQSHITAVNKINMTKSTNDPLSRSLVNSKVVFQGEHDANVASITLPIGTNNTPAAIQGILDMPPTGESATSLMGKQRYYNKADMIVLVSNSTVTVKSGYFDNFATTISTSQYDYFLNTSVTFYNKREAKTVQTTEIDIGKLRTWSGTNSVLRPLLGNRDVRSIYVADMRSQTSSTESGVRVINGQTLPSLGLTVATPNPLYVKGHYNAPSGALGTTNTSGTLPASLVGDAVTVLSTAWSDANSGLTMSSTVRNANDTTVNAAFLGGIVPSGNGNYSGGVENFPRFLEDWGNNTLTYNGSMVVMFNSRYATAPWGGSDVYSPPNRNWAFDINFMDPTKLPPGTPEAKALIRGQWASIKPGTIP